MPYTLPAPIRFFRATHYSLGRNAKVRAIVNHRMVGYLTGTRAHFTNPTVRNVSTHFGIGIISGKVAIDQYVPLDDTAYGNGNYDTSGSWDNWGYSLSNINAQTINIEHQDYGDPAGTGVVSEATQQASIALQRLLLYGSIDEWKAAGIVFRSWANAPIIQSELRAIVPGPRTIITHNDISGRLKPYCWLPWQADKIGFPRSKYIAGITKVAAPPPPDTSTGGEDMPAFTAPTQTTVVKVAAQSWLYVNSDFSPNPSNVQISTNRDMPLVGTYAGGSIVSYVGSDGVNTGRTYYLKNESIMSKSVLSTAGDIAAATAPLLTKIDTLTKQVALLDAAVAKEAVRIKAIKDKTAVFAVDIAND